MSDAAFFIKGFMIGFAIAAPVGPIGVLCIRRTLAHGIRSGLASGTGAAVADAAYGAVAAFGLTAVSSFLQQFSTPLQVAGGAFLLWLGIRTFLQKPASDAAAAVQGQLHTWKEVAQDFSSTVFLTLTNPATILSFIAIFSGLGIVQGSPDYGLSALMVLGVFLGSFAWWCILTGGVGFVRHRLDGRMLKGANILSGLVIGGFGVFSLGHAIYVNPFSGG